MALKRWWKAPASVLLVASMLLASFPASRAAAAESQPAPNGLTAPDDTTIALPSTGEVIVKFRKPEAKAGVMALAGRGGQVKPQRSSDRMVVKLPAAPAQARAMIKALRRTPGVAYVENNERMKALDVPNDPMFGNLWGLKRIHADQAWATVGTNQESVTVAVVDSGVDAQHPDLAGNLLSGFDAINNSDDVTDENGHGTHVSGTIAGVSDNGIGVTGVAGPANVKILPVKVLDADGWGDVDDIAEGIRWAVNNGADVINLSLGGGYSETMAEAIRYAADHDVVVVSAAGNEHANTAHLSPAGVPGTVTVSAVDEQVKPAYFSNFGDEVELAAPGVRILSTIPGNQYSSASGTSMATPHVAAVAALVKAAHPEYTRAEVQGCLFATVEKVDAVTAEYGAGLVRADLAVACDASELPSEYDFKLEAPGTNQPLRGLTTFTFDANPKHVATIEVTADGAAVGSASVTTGLTDVDVDLSTFVAGPVTLTATALDSNGVTVATITRTYRVAGPAYVVRVTDENGDPAPYVSVELYVEYVDRWAGGMDTEWEDAGSQWTDANGQIALSNATFPEGYRVMAVADFSAGDGHEILRYGIIDAPGVLDLSDEVVLTRFDATAVPTQSGAFMVSPDGIAAGNVDGIPLWLWPSEGVVEAWLPAGDYAAIFTSWEDHYLLPQHVTISAAAHTVTADLTNTAQLTWAPTPGRTYSSVYLPLVVPGMRWGTGFGLYQPTGSESFTVKQGDYVTFMEVSLLDSQEYEWTYSFSTQNVTVGATGATVREGTPQQAIRASGAPSVMPGKSWNASFSYPLKEGGYLWDVSGPSAEDLAAAKTAGFKAVQVRTDRAPREWTVTPKSATPAPAAKARAEAWLAPTMVIKNSTGKVVSNAADIDTWSIGATWNVPAKFASGSYKADVKMNAGPLGILSAELPVTVGADSISDGVRVLVTDTQGKPVSGANVELFLSLNVGNGQTRWVATNSGRTGADGYVRLYQQAAKSGAKVKVAVTYGSYALIKDATAPTTLTVSLSDTHPVTIVPTDENGEPMLDAAVGFAYVDEQGNPLLTSYGADVIGGAVTFNLGAGTMRFTNTDFWNGAFTLGDPVTITTATKTVNLPAGELAYLALDPAAQFADGSPVLPNLSFASPSGFPGVVPLGYLQESYEWRVTPGLYDHHGLYERFWQDQYWQYELAGGELVMAPGYYTIPLGGAFSASIADPIRYGSNGYYFPVEYRDSHGNALLDMSSEEMGLKSIMQATRATATKAKWKAMLNSPQFARLQQQSLAAKVGRQALAEAGMTAQYTPTIAPVLTVQDSTGSEVWRDTDSMNWFQAAYYAPAGAKGTYTARIALGVGPEGNVADEVTFDVTGATLAVTPTVFNPTTGKLTITLQLPTTDTYSVEIQNQQGAKVKSLAANKTGSGSITMTWDGKNDSGKLVANGIYRAAVTTQSGTSSASFKLRIPLTPVKPTVTAQATIVNKESVTLTGSTTAGFGLTAQVKGPGETTSTQFSGLGIADTSGKFSISVPLTPNDGAYQIQVQSFDPEDGRVSAWSSTVTVTRDTVNPTLTVTAPKAVEGVLLVNSTRVTFQGTTEPSATVTATVSDPGKPPVVKSGKADSKGIWSIQSLTVSDASSVSLSAVDPAGNASEAAAFAVTLDQKAPSVRTADDGKPAVSVWIINSGIELRPVVDKKSLTYSASGAGATGFTLEVYTDEDLGSVKVTPAVKGNDPVITGSFFKLPLTPNKNGSTTYTVDIYDLAGNKTTLPNIIVKLDSTGPAISISQPTAATVLATNVEKVPTVQLKGTANETLTTVQVIDTEHENAVLATATPDSTSFTVPVTLPAIEGTYKLRVVGYDLAGNVSAPNGTKDIRSVNVDMTDPKEPVLTAPVVYEGNNLYVTSTSATLQGKAEPGVTVYAQVGTAAPVKTTASSSGAFSLTAKFTGNTADVTVWAVDAAANQSLSTLYTLKLDKTAITVDTLSVVVGSNEYPLTKNAKGTWTYPDPINVYDAENVAVQGTSAEPVSKVLVNDKAVPFEAGDGTFQAVLPSVKGGGNSLTLKVYDRAGNVVSVPVSFKLDAPTVTVTGNNLVTKTGGTPFTFAVTASEPLQDFEVIVDLRSGTADGLSLEYSPVKGSDTKFAVTGKLPATGTFDLYLNFVGTDKEGNLTSIGSAGQFSRRLCLDTTAPEIAMTGTWEPVMLTSMSSFPVQGRVTDFGAGLKSLTVNGTTVAVDSEGRFLKSVTVNEGVTKIEVKATDLVGNVTTTTTQLVRKSKISTLSVAKSGPTGGKLTISGTTDKPVVVNGTPVVAVDLQIIIKDKAGAARMILDPITAGADGKYSVTGVDVSGLGKGTYTIEVTARVHEFLLIKKATTTFTVN